MNVRRVNKWVTFGNVGVLAGISLLVFELGQTREMTRAQTRSEVAAQIVDLLRDVSTDPQLADVMGRAHAGEELTAAENRQFRHRSLAMLRYFENVHYQYRQGLYAESEFTTQEEAWRGFMTAGGYEAVWCSMRETFSVEFRTAFDRLLPHGC